jgi:hypothetical protein
MSLRREIKRFIYELRKIFNWFEYECYMRNKKQYRKVAVAIRKQTRVLPMDISVSIAKDVLSSEFFDRYKVKILEVVILGYRIHDDCYGITEDSKYVNDPTFRYIASDLPDDFGTTRIVKRAWADNDDVRYETNYEIMSQEIPYEWLDMVAREILESHMAEAVVDYIYEDNVTMSILGKKKICINLPDITNWCDLPILIPKSYKFLESMFIRDNSKIALENETSAGTPESFRFNDVLHRYLKQFNFETEFVCEEQ